jgi:uncharacterized repeat protein (TIGR01451 family)
MHKRKFLTAGATVVLVAGMLAGASAVLAVHDEGMQLEGNATAADLTYTDLDPGAAPRPGVLAGAYAGLYDWDSLVTITGTPAPGNAEGAATPIADASLPDGFTNSDFQKDFNNTGTTFLTFDTTTFATGSKDGQDIPGWQCNRDANVNSKIDIMNGFAAVMEQGTHKFLYFGLDKAKDNGNNNVGIWMLQDPSVGCVSSGSAVTFTGHHVVGDLLIVSAFTNGGGVSSITAYEWIADIDPKPAVTTPGINPDPVATSADCLDITGQGLVDRLCAVVNGKTVFMPFLTADNGVINAAHPSPNFWEGGLELTAFQQFAGTCFNRYILDTRASQSLTATLFDYVQGQLNTCAPSTNLTKTASATTVHSGDPVTYTYVETNDGNRILTSPSVEDDSCASVTYVSGDSNSDGKLDPGEAWTFTCTVAHLTATTTNTAIGHGFDGTNDVTFCTGTTTPANTICDPDERAQATVTVIAPATELTLKSQTPSATTPIYATTSVTIVVTEKNTGNDTLTGVSVTGSGCTTWTAVGTFSGTLAPGASQDFTCTYTPGLAGTGWSALGHGTDSLGVAVPATGETVSGTVIVIAPATTLTLKSQTPSATTPIYAGTSVTIVVTETNTGVGDLHGVSVTGSGCTTWTAVGTFSGTLAAGASQDFTCTYVPGVSTNGWSATGHGLDANGNAVPTTGETVSGTVIVINPSTILTKAALVNATVIYSYTEKNDGDVALTAPSVHDDKCASVVGVDVNADGYNDGDTTPADHKLSPGETWLFTCTTTISGITSSATLTNIATGHALDPNGVDITPPLDPDETDTTTVTISITGGK